VRHHKEREARVKEERREKKRNRKERGEAVGLEKEMRNYGLFFLLFAYAG
jgi:hypothetical protein